MGPLPTGKPDWEPGEAGGWVAGEPNNYIRPGPPGRRTWPYDATTSVNTDYAEMT
jgi:hypothetical protein